jgi:hypothetical protein
MLDTVHCPRYIRNFSRVAGFVVFKLLIVIVLNTVLSCYHSNTGIRRIIRYIAIAILSAINTTWLQYFTSHGL